ncbi:MAG TPA: PPOX class F420-dependent oxidoreductase [Actinobacteria bacterium]|jgi:PPOX class probable F420-dependent enzyme|nr:PPOX class F420-dependent oxidoreductase [Actinomycetota bacterium]
MADKLTPEQKDLFDSKHFATIATINPDGQPQLSIVWCAIDGDEILVSTVEGRRKHLNLERDNRVSIIASPRDEPYKYVEVRGTAAMTRKGGRELIDQLAYEYMGADRYPADDDTNNIRVVIRVTPQRVVARGI